jgi:hypothetical protein
VKSLITWLRERGSPRKKHLEDELARGEMRMQREGEPVVTKAGKRRRRTET